MAGVGVVGLSQETDWDAVRLASPSISSESMLDLVQHWIELAEAITEGAQAEVDVTPDVRFQMAVTQYRWSMQRTILIRLWQTVTEQRWPTK